MPGVRAVSADGWVQTGLFDPHAPVPYSLTAKAEVELDLADLEQSADD